MLEISFSWEEYSGRILKSAPREPFPPDDSILVHPFADRLRIALIDGITDTPYTKSQANLSGGSWASSVVEASLKAPQDIRICLMWANNILWDRHQRYRRAQQQASVVAVDLFRDGRMEVLRAGDTFFALRQKRWERVFAGDPRDPEAIQYFVDRGIWTTPGQFQSMQEFLALGGWTPEDYGGPEEPFGDPDVWQSTPIGSFEEVKLQRRFLQADEWREAAFGTDGAEPEDVSLVAETDEIGSDESFCLLSRA